MKVNRCMRSFSASSNNVRIHPPSRLRNPQNQSRSLDNGGTAKLTA